MRFLPKSLRPARTSRCSSFQVVVRLPMLFVKWTGG
jgi:hypothetical protein